MCSRSSKIIDKRMPKDGSGGGASKDIVEVLDDAAPGAGVPEELDAA